jgi:uncharacterized membrane protein
MEYRKSLFDKTQAWQLSIITAVLSLVLVFALAGLGKLLLVNLLGISINTSEPIEDLFSYLSTGILLAVACFIICRRNPKSIWYTPIICNALGILAAFDPGFWSSERWIAFGIGWILSLIGALVGTLIARRGVK